MPILYSYRRCPYAMRARMALEYAGVSVETREISLRDKPAQMLEVSPKGTVPVLLLDNGQVIDESLQIMHWVLAQSDKEGWLLTDNPTATQLIGENDSSFKQALDAYKYSERFPHKTQLEHRLQGELFLQKLEDLLQHHRFLFANTITLADVAIFPFIRQFVAVDAHWFEHSSYSQLRQWLDGLVNWQLFTDIMEKRPTYFNK